MFDLPFIHNNILLWKLFHCKLFASDDINAGWESRDGIRNSRLFLYQCALGVINVHLGAGSLQLGNAGLYARHACDMLDVE